MESYSNHEGDVDLYDGENRSDARVPQRHDAVQRPNEFGRGDIQ